MGFEEVINADASDFARVSKAAKRASAAAAAIDKMLVSGQIRDIPKKLSELDEQLVAAAAGIRAFQERWARDDLAVRFGSQAYVAELTKELDRLGVDHHWLDDVLYVYPVLVRIDKGASAVRINKKAEVRLRPTTLARLLRDLQDRPARFPASRFLAAIMDACKTIGSPNLPKGQSWTGRSYLLRDVHKALTLLPGVDYTEQEFVRDIYLLDCSSSTLEVRNHIAKLEASSATRDEKKTLSIITRDGKRRLYSSIRFTPTGR